MLDNIGKSIPAISLAAVAVLSVFNVGYFWNIGLHFLGLADLTNFVYSFGLATTFLVVFLSAAAIALPARASPNRVIALGIVGAVISMSAIFFGSRFIANEFIQEGITLVGFAISGAAAMRWLWLRHHLLNNLVTADFVMLGIVVIGNSFQAGIFTALLEMNNWKTYSVAIKDQMTTIENVRILRSSSSGFILFADKQTLFVPHSEIRQIRAMRSLP